MNRLASSIAAAIIASAPTLSHGAEAPHNEPKALEYTRLALGGSTSYHTHKPQLFAGFHAKYEDRTYYFDNPNLHAGEGVFHGGIDINLLHLLGQDIDPDELSVHAGVDLGLYSMGQKGLPPGHIGGSIHLESHNWGAKLDIAPGDVTAEIGYKIASIIYRDVTNHLLDQDETSLGLKVQIPLGKRFSIVGTVEGSTGHEVSLDTRKYISLILNWDIPHGEHRPHDDDQRHHKHDDNHKH